MLAGYAAAGLGLNLVRRTHPIAIVLLLGGIVNVALCLLVIPRFGSEGAAFATLAATLVMTAYLFRQSERAYPIGYRLVPVAAIVAVAGACCAVGLHLPVWTRYALFMMALAAGTGSARASVPALFARSSLASRHRRRHRAWRSPIPANPRSLPPPARCDA